MNECQQLLWQSADGCEGGSPSDRAEIEGVGAKVSGLCPRYVQRSSLMLLVINADFRGWAASNSSPKQPRPFEDPPPLAAADSDDGPRRRLEMLHAGRKGAEQVEKADPKDRRQVEEDRQQKKENQEDDLQERLDRLDREKERAATWRGRLRCWCKMVWRKCKPSHRASMFYIG